MQVEVKDIARLLLDQLNLLLLLVAVLEGDTDFDWEAVLEDQRRHQTNVERLLRLCQLFPEERVRIAMLEVPWLVKLDDLLEGIDLPLV